MRVSLFVLIVLLVIIFSLIIRVFFYVLPILLLVWLISYIVGLFNKDKRNQYKSDSDSNFKRSNNTYDENIYEKPKANQDVIDVEYKEKDIE